MSVAVIVLNWNGAADSIACLDSLVESEVPVTPIVVDNGSTDGSVELIRASHPEVVILQTGANLGYAGGNNRGIDHAISSGFDHVCVLNNDTVAAPTMIGRLLSATTHAAPGAATSPKIVRFDDGSVWYDGAEPGGHDGLPVHVSSPEPGATTSFLTGCCIFASAEVWQLVGRFDEDYFLIFEDSEWSRRARAAGVTLTVTHSAVLRHRVSASFDRAGDVGDYYWTRNALHFRWTGSGRRDVGSAFTVAVRPGLSDLRHRRPSAGRLAAIRLVALTHAYRGHLGPARGRALRRLGLTR